ncbi:hypothetical protein ACNOYE_03595 [Nannocystaceae bacterium ST9]
MGLEVRRAQAPLAPALAGPRLDADEHLALRFNEVVFWPDLGPKLDPQSVASPSGADIAIWYLGYATMDLLECIEWQLAEGHDRFDESESDNPFWPLVRCNASGFHPFSFGPTEVVLFALR